MPFRTAWKRTIHADYPNLEVVFLPDSARIVSPLKLVAMFKFHAMYQAIVMHNLLDKNAAMQSELLIDNNITLQYVLQAWRTAFRLISTNLQNLWLVSGILVKRFSLLGTACTESFLQCLSPF